MPAARADGGYKVDLSRGQRIGRVSSEWFSRPDDERFLSLSELHARRCRAAPTAAGPARSRARRSGSRRAATMPSGSTLMLPGADAPVAPTHWSFGQLASLVGAPAAYLRQLPAPLAGINLQYGLTAHRAEQVKTLETDDGRIELRAVTGPDYGRIYDHELVAAVQRIAGNGTGDTRWKVPGVLDWSTRRLQPARRRHQGDDHALRLGSRRLPVPGRRPQPDRGRAPAGRLARPLLPRLLLLELGGRREDARHRQLLPPRRLPEPQSLGRRGLRGDHHPALASMPPRASRTRPRRR